MGNSRNRERGQMVGPKKTKRYRRIWKTLFGDRYKKLLAYARKLTNDDTNARDAVQEALVHLLESVPNPTLITNHGAYMASVVRNISRKSARNKNEVQLDEENESEPAFTTEPEILEWLSINESLERVAAKSREDTDRCLRRIKLAIAGFSTQEIAARLNEKESTTRYRLAVFRVSLRKVINKNGPPPRRQGGRKGPQT